MSRASIIYPLIIGALSFVLWALLNQPDQLPPWPQTIQGFTFNPLQRFQDPEKGDEPSVEDIDKDLGVVEGKSHSVRTYTVEGNLGEIPRLAKQHNLNVALGAWIGAEDKKNREEIERLFVRIPDRTLAEPAAMRVGPLDLHE